MLAPAGPRGVGLRGNPGLDFARHGRGRLGLDRLQVKPGAGAFRRCGLAACVVVVTVLAYGSSSALAAHPPRRKSPTAPEMCLREASERVEIAGGAFSGRARSRNRSTESPGESTAKTIHSQRGRSGGASCGSVRFPRGMPANQRCAPRPKERGSAPGRRGGAPDRKSK